jgi:NADH dehydrogenase
MEDILVVGGGFAGAWSAVAAARVSHDAGVPVSVTLVAPSDDLVMRPRLYEENPEQMRVSLDRMLRPVGIHRVPAIVTEIDTGQRSVTAVDRDGHTRTLEYQRLVLATGSRLRRPDLPGIELAHDVDTLAGAVALDSHLRCLPAAPSGPGRFTAVVVGAGFTGVEVATEMASRMRRQAERCGAGQEVHVVLVDRADVVGPDLGAGPRPAIEAALNELGVELRLGRTLSSIDAQRVRLDDGEELAARTVVWTAGIESSPLTKQIPGRRDALGRLEVDQYLRVPEAPEVYAAGDTSAALAEDGYRVMPSCQHASQLGRYAGHNAAAGLLDRPLAPFRPDPYVTCLDLGAAGAVFTTGWERTIQTTGAEAKRRKRRVNEQWIYPPVDDATEILRRAHYAVSTREPAM